MTVTVRQFKTSDSFKPLCLKQKRRWHFQKCQCAKSQRKVMEMLLIQGE